jgi:hypothetical protein
MTPYPLINPIRWTQTGLKPKTSQKSKALTFTQSFLYSTENYRRLVTKESLHKILVHQQQHSISRRNYISWFNVMWFQISDNRFIVILKKDQDYAVIRD